MKEAETKMYCIREKILTNNRLTKEPNGHWRIKANKEMFPINKN